MFGQTVIWTYLWTFLSLRAEENHRKANQALKLSPRSARHGNFLRVQDAGSCSPPTKAGVLMGVLDYNLLHMLRQFYLRGEEVTRSIVWLIKRLLKVGAKVAYHGRRRYVHVSSAFPLVRHYRAVFWYVATDVKTG